MAGSKWEGERIPNGWGSKRKRASAVWRTNIRDCNEKFVKGYTIGGHILEQVEEEKDLGVTINDKFKVDKHRDGS